MPQGMMGWMILMLMVIAVRAAAGEGEAARHLLFYGNSFTGVNDVPASIARLAEVAGHPVPVIVRNVAGGKRMLWHLEQTQTQPASNIEAKAIEGHRYDVVILQGYSTEPTHVGDREAFVRHTLELAKLVRGSDAGRDATFVLYQTWARGPGNKVYPDGFAEPAQMQRELVEGYEAAAKAMAEEFGEASVVVAPVGTAFGLVGFDRQLYGDDIYHAGPVGSLLAAMVLYRTLYGGKIADLDKQALAQARTAEKHWLGLTDDQWNMVAKAADQCDVGRPALKPTTAPN